MILDPLRKVWQQQNGKNHRHIDRRHRFSEREQLPALSS